MRLQRPKSQWLSLPVQHSNRTRNGVRYKLETFKVYVVEDSPVIRDALIERIEEHGKFKVVGFAETASDAIEGLRQNEPNVVLLDLHLKEGSGYDVLRGLNSHAVPAVEHVVVFSNNASAMHQKVAKSLGASRFFDKSMQFEEMLDALHAWAETQKKIHLCILQAALL